MRDLFLGRSVLRPLRGGFSSGRTGLLIILKEINLVKVVNNLLVIY